MKILHSASLIKTIDAFNEAFFFGYPWQHEAKVLVDWVGSRLGKERAYAGSFALTASDWNDDFRLFTGERVVTRAARSHIIAEESTRMLNLIWKEIGLDSDSRKESEDRLGAKIFSDSHSTAASNGFYCCGKCSLSLWRCIAGGGFSGHKEILKRGIASLVAARDGLGGWRRFPFYYTLLVLGEIDAKLAASEIHHCRQRLERASQRLSGKTDSFSKRRLILIQRLLSKHGS